MSCKNCIKKYRYNLIVNTMFCLMTLLLTFVADEEYGSIGTESILKIYLSDAAIICEPTGLGIVIAHKGFAWIDVEVFGRAAHGSLPGEGIDAIAKAGKILIEVERLGEEILPQKTHPLLGSSSIHASLIQGGSQICPLFSFFTKFRKINSIAGNFFFINSYTEAWTIWYFNHTFLNFH